VAIGDWRLGIGKKLPLATPMNDVLEKRKVIKHFLFKILIYFVVLVTEIILN
jgi:uncharacterized membrane protein